jgi:hypothetical protein
MGLRKLLVLLLITDALPQQLLLLAAQVDEFGAALLQLLVGRFEVGAFSALARHSHALRCPSLLGELSCALLNSSRRRFDRRRLFHKQELEGADFPLQLGLVRFHQQD